MDFYEALRCAANGDKITKREWGNQKCWGQMLEGKLVLHKPDDVYYPWTISDGDLMGNDWEIIMYA